MKHKTLFIAALAAIPMLAPSAAEARSYQSAERCKTYTKTMNIDGRRKYASGKACEQSNGVWKIVRIGGSQAARHHMREHIIDKLYDRGYDVVGYDDHYDREYYDRNYRNAYFHPRNYGQYKKRHKQSSKHNRARDYDGRECRERR